MQGEQRPGDWKFVCALSGFEGWASDSVKLANGSRVLRRFAGSETARHPQEHVGARYPNEGRVPWSQPPGTDVFIEAGSVTPDDL